MSTIITAECPCGSKNSLATCCGRFLSGHDFPKTAEELMRARYTAFTLVDLDFIQKTFSPKTIKTLILMLHESGQKNLSGKV
ncbi:MAG: YchJ family metal-binding protein [Pseudomonadota bacterium]